MRKELVWRDALVVVEVSCGGCGRSFQPAPRMFVQWDGKSDIPAGRIQEMVQQAVENATEYKPGRGEKRWTFRDGALICPTCTNELERPECKCGQRAKYGDRFCPSCGTAIVWPPEEP